MNEQFPNHRPLEVLSPPEGSGSPPSSTGEANHDRLAVKLERIIGIEEQFTEMQQKAQSARRQDELSAATLVISRLSRRYVSAISDQEVQANASKVAVTGESLGLLKTFFKSTKVPEFEDLLGIGTVLREGTIDVNREQLDIYDQLVEHTDLTKWQLNDDEKSWLQKVAVASALSPTDPDKEEKEEKATAVYMQPPSPRKTVSGARVVDATHQKGVGRIKKYDSEGKPLPNNRRKPSKLHQLVSPKQRRLVQTGYYDPKPPKPRGPSIEPAETLPLTVHPNTLTFEETRRLLKDVPITLSNRHRLSGAAKGMTVQQALEIAKEDALRRLRLDREIELHTERS